MRNKLAFALLLAAAAPASAHVTLATPATAPANSTVVAQFRVGHGCGASPTIALTVTFPEEVSAVRPQAKPGWTIEMTRTPLATPAKGEGGATVTERISTITWKGGSLPADQFDDFAVMMRLPAAPGPLVFPAIQTCTSSEQRWTDMPMEGMRMPNAAPVLTVLPAKAGASDDGMAGMGGM